jgi:hypothetical protein
MGAPSLLAISDADPDTPLVTVLEARRTLGPDDSRTHIPFSFIVERECARLEIGFSYEPRFLQDDEKARAVIQEGMSRFADSLEDPDPAAWRTHAPLSNLLTLSLDGPRGFRGCGHRSPRPQPVMVCRTTATPGFLPGPIEPGLWRATVSVHCVVTERCTVHLVVRVRDGGAA